MSSLRFFCSLTLGLGLPCALAVEDGGMFGHVKVASQVEVAYWDFSDPNFSRKIVDGGKPVIFRTHPAMKWKAFEGSPGFADAQAGFDKAAQRTLSKGQGVGGKWQKPDFLINELKPDTDLHVTKSRGENFAYSRVTEHRPSYPGWKAPTTEGWTTVGRFGKAIKKDTKAYVQNTTLKREREYYSKIIDSDSIFMKVLWDVYPFKFLVPFGEESDTTVHVWWGGAGTRSTPHYDQSHNLFLQVVGEKRFFLASPEYFTQFHMYPLHNPSGRHSQLANGWPLWDREKYPMATAEDEALLRKHLPEGEGSRWGELEMLEASLLPGDLLYIPSLWYHTTEATGTTESLGLSFWSTNMDMLEITIEKELSKKCAEQIEALDKADKGVAKAKRTKPAMIKLKAMLFASIMRVFDMAYDLHEPRKIPHVPGPIMRAVLLRHLGRFHKGVCNTKEYRSKKLHVKTPPAKWMAQPARVTALADSAKGTKGSRAYEKIPCLRDAASILAEWNAKLDKGAGLTGKATFKSYGGIKRVAPIVIEGLAGGVLGHQAACSWFAEVYLHLKAEALADTETESEAASRNSLLAEMTGDV